MTKFTNTTQGPKGVHTTTGLVYVGAGATSDDLTVAEGNLVAAKLTGWFTIDGEVPSITVQPVQVIDAPLAGSGEAIQIPTVDAVTGEPVPPVAGVTGEVAETFDAELLEAATDAELAEMHEKKFGRPPHHAAKRETIIAKLAAPAEA